ncbi:MAG: RHS repeat-associated core domain-containing protein [Kiritimatiellia bacterium]
MRLTPILALAWLIFASLSLTAVLPPIALAAGGDPQVSNVTASQRTGTKLVDITYDVTATNSVTVTVTVSTNSGVSYNLTATSVSGDAGAGITPGTGKAIVWDAGADWPGQYSTAVRVKVTADDNYNPPLPPDPATVAPAVSNGVVTIIGQSTAFLYTGANPIQTGVASGTISAVQVAVLRGRALTRAGEPLSGVTVAINNHPEFGRTLTRTNGQYDMAVNGGGILHLNFSKNGYLPVQRTYDVPWQDYLAIDDVVMIPSDSGVAVVSLPSTNWQVALGSLTSDERGERRPRVLFPPGTRAWIHTYAGGTQETATLTTRFTEYTVGTNGPAAMPGDLPATVAYTYCVEAGADEAQATVAGASVLFSTNVLYYLDNFLRFPAGAGIPLGYYDEDAGVWLPAPDGIVMDLKGTNADGLALVSLSTNGTLASDEDLLALGITADERRVVAQTYAPAVTQSVWRMPVEHFSRKDFNPAKILPNGAQKPKPPSSTAGQQTGSPQTQGGYGTLDLDNQAFRESLPIAGTPFSLNYTSARMPGSSGGASVTFPLSGGSVPASLKRIELRTSIAGQSAIETFSPAVNLNYTYTWNGKDAYSRTVRGYQPLQVTLGYVYDTTYAISEFQARTFGLPSSMRMPDGTYPGPEKRLDQSVIMSLCYAPVAVSQGFGDWTLDVLHVYNPISETIHFGNGSMKLTGDAVRPWDTIINTVGGNGTGGFSGDGGPATNAAMHYPAGIAIAPDGSIYFSDWWNNRIRRIYTDGTIATVGGNGTGGFSGDGGPAANAALSHPQGLAFGPDGSLYVADAGNYRVRRIGTDGIISTVAGSGASSYSGDNGLAIQAGFGDFVGLAVGPDGVIYVAEFGSHRIRRIAPDGYIVTIAGTGDGGFSGDGGFAANASLQTPFGVAVASDGALLIADTGNHRVRRVETDGIITTVAGDGAARFYGDGEPATNASLWEPYQVLPAADNAFYVADSMNYRVRQVNSDGIILTIAGNGTAGYSGDNKPSPAAQIQSLVCLASSKHALYLADYYNNRIRRMAATLPPFSTGTTVIPSDDATLLYEFDSDGRHLRTLNSLTGSNLYVFAYTNGFLQSITDGDGLVTTIERAADGAPQAIRSPYGQRTVLTIENGSLTAVTDPCSQTTRMTYDGSRLTSVVGANGAAYVYTVAYDGTGNVTRVTDPAGGYTTVGKNSWSNGYEAASTSALGRVNRVRVDEMSTGNSRRTVTAPDGTLQISDFLKNGYETNQLPEGTVVGSEYGPDPRYGMQAPLVQRRVVRLPSGLASTSMFTRVTDGASLTDTVTLNGRATTNVYAYSNRLLSATSPAGRKTTTSRDALGRPLVVSRPGVLAVTNTYDSHGRLISAQTGSRVTQYAYDANGFLSQVTDALGRTNRMTCDDIGRVTSHVLPDGRTIQYTYDAQGNRTSVTPPGRSAHTFAFSLVDLVTNYTAPGGTPQVTIYNAERQPVQLDRGGGQVLSFGYDAAGRPGTNNLAGNRLVFAYLANGLVNSIAATGGVTIGYTYDGKLITRLALSGVVTGAVAYAYDNDFRPVSEIVNGAFAAAYSFDADGLLTNAGPCRLGRAPESGLLTGISLSNATDTFAYNGYGEVTNYTALTNGYPVFSVAYARDALGRIESATETVEGAAIASTYQYDPAGRLVAVVTNGAGTNSYAYDGNGNRTSWVVNGVSWSAAYDGQDRLTNMQSASSTQQFLYNTGGDLTNKISEAGVTGYTYDGGGNLMAVDLPGGTNIAYRVDGFGRRVAKFVDGVFTQGFLYGSGLLPLAELDAQSNVVSRFVYGGGNAAPLYMIRSGNVYRIITDHRGSPRLVVQADTGAIAQRLDYDEWGRVLNDSAPGFQPFGFAGGLYDADTGLVRFGARDYAPETGRWLIRDPAGFMGPDVNLYAYCSNDPVNLADSLGLGPNWVTMGTGAGQMGYGSWQVISGVAAATAGGGPLTPAGAWGIVQAISGVNNFGYGVWNVASGIATPDKPAAFPSSQKPIVDALQEYNEHGIPLSEFGSDWHPELPPGYLPASTQQHLMDTYGPKPETAPCSQNCYPLSL